ncbi:MAG: helix-turn-helix domain-containing protein [Ruminococcus sp.]|nr:helix-turn-helix domain-containing protein [Ruminococcus sp.]
MDKDIKSIMKRFATERKKFGTQEKVAEIVGINAKTISAFENGRRTPSLLTFLKMCDAINADMNYILEIEREDKV